MNTFTKAVWTFLAVATISSAAIASPSDAIYGVSNRAQAYVPSLEAQASSVDLSVDTNSAFAASKMMSTDMNDRVEFIQNTMD